MSPRHLERDPNASPSDLAADLEYSGAQAPRAETSMLNAKRNGTVLVTRLASFATAAALCVTLAGAQETGKPTEKATGAEPTETAPAPRRGIGPEPELNPFEEIVVQDDAQKQMVELFGRVERRLNEIDRLLSDASAGDTSRLADVGPSGIDDLLDLSRRQGKRALEDIDEILKLAEQMEQQCQSPGSSSQCEKPGASGSSGKPSPIDQAGQQSTKRESTPEAPPQTAQSQGEQPKPGDKPDSEDSKPGDDGTPKSPLSKDDPNPSNAPGQNPPGSESELARTINDLDRWGDLPVHARDVFRTEGGGDMPARYRDWIDSYYRRLNERR